MSSLLNNKNAIKCEESPTFVIAFLDSAVDSSVREADFICGCDGTNECADCADCR